MNSDLEVNELTWTIEHLVAPRISQMPIPAMFKTVITVSVVSSRLSYNFELLEL